MKGKSKHEAILLECNTDDPKQFLDEQIDVKIRWKVADTESVPTRNVELQNIDTIDNSLRIRKAAAVAVDSKKRKLANDEDASHQQ